MNMAAKPAHKMDEYDIPLTEMVTYRLSRLNAQLNAQAARILKETAGLSLAQWRVLVVLDTNGKVPPSEIVRSTAVDKGQLSRTLKGMTSEGLIASEASESDSRSHLLSMTAKGRELFETARPAMRERQLCLLESLGGEERDVLFTALDKIGAAARELEGRQ
jgi:DNA-binding MarR family transcriptional regulator